MRVSPLLSVIARSPKGRRGDLPLIDLMLGCVGLKYATRPTIPMVNTFSYFERGAHFGLAFCNRMESERATPVPVGV